MKRQQIISAATALFLEHGFGQVSMDAIVEKAGVSKRTLYNYYDSKEKLFLDVIVDHMETVWLALEPERSSNGTLEEKLRTVATEILTIAMKPEPMALYRTMIGESQRFPDLAQAFYDVSSKRVMLALADMISEFGPSAGIDAHDPVGQAEHYLDLVIGGSFMRIVMGIEKPMTGKTISAHVDQALARFLAAARA